MFAPGADLGVQRSALLSAVIIATLVASCDAPSPPGAPPPWVTAAPPLIAPVQDDIVLTGQTGAVATVDLVARVPGFLREVGFADGADVQKGQVLFRIEDEPYAAQVALAQAALDQQQAALKSAEAEFSRQDALRKQYVATQTSYDNALAAREAGHGSRRRPGRTARPRRTRLRPARPRPARPRPSRGARRPRPAPRCRRGAALSGAQSLSFTATAPHDVPSAEGQSVLYTVQSRVALRRPDCLRVDTTGDGAPSLFVSDGRTMTLYRPLARTAATAPAPPGLEAVLKAEIAAAGQAQAFADMLLPDPARGLTAGLTRAFVVGRSRLVGGVETEVVAFASPDAQGQIWIGAQDRLARQLFVTETGAPGRPRSGVAFSDWRLDLPLDDRTFSAAGAEGTASVPFTRPGL